MNGPVSVRSEDVTRARNSLADARTSLDDAMRSISGPDGETVMANSDLVELLLQAVAARRHLEDVERRRSISPLTSVR